MTVGAQPTTTTVPSHEDNGGLMQRFHLPRARRHKGLALLLALAATATVALALTAGSSATPAATNGSITVWLSGTYAGATPGSTYRKWLDSIKARYEKANPGSKVTFVLTPINNAQFTAQIAAAFASNKVPDAMLVYSGGYTTPYMLSSLQKLNDDVNKTAGFYASQTSWDLSCLNLDCKGGKGDIYAIPNDAGTYGLFYNKALFKKAGVAKPPTTYTQFLADCTKFKAKGIIPLAYGDRDGYSTDNWVTYDYSSYMAPGDIAKINDGKLKYATPNLVKPLTQLAKFKQQGCVNPDASTHENNDANTYLHVRKIRNGAHVPVRDQGLRAGARQEPRPRPASAVGPAPRAAPPRTRSTTG